MIGRQSGDHRPNDGRYLPSVCRRFCDQISSTDSWRSSADWRPMIGRPSADIMMLISSKRRPTVGRSSSDHRPTLYRWQNPWKSADRSKNFTLGCLYKKLVGRPKNPQNHCRCRPTIDRCRPSFPNFAHRPSADRRFGECDCSITYPPIFRS